MSKKMTKAEWLEKNGFNAEGLTYCVFGEDTFAIKDWLKEQGCKFNPFLKWHSPEPIDVPAGYGIIGFTFDEICEYSEKDGDAYFFEQAKALIERRFAEAEGPSLSSYYGQIGDRLRNQTAVYRSRRGYSNNYGYTNIYTFTIGDDVLVWFSTAEIGDIEKGTPVLLSGTVKKFEEFRGVKTTHLSRCIVKPIT